MAEDLRAGVYRHYRGPLYLVLGLGHDANADVLYQRYDDGQGVVPADAFEPYAEREVVVYVGLQLDGAHLGPRLSVRTREDFDAMLHADGQVCTDATWHPWTRDLRCLTGWDLRRSTLEAQPTLVRRFTYQGPGLTTEMMEEVVK